MSLRAALARIPDDRDTVFALSAMMRYFDAHRGEPVRAGSVSRAAGLSSKEADALLEVLVDCFVLDFASETRVYKYEPDALLDIETSRLLRRADGHVTMVKANLARFRDRGA